MLVPEIVEIELGEAWKLRENGAAVAIPLLLKKGVRRVRSYRLLSEVADQVRLVDSGNINNLNILNDSSDTVLIRKGSIVKGNTQTRAVTISVAVAPKSRTSVDIKCIYASKSIRGGTNFEFSDKIAPLHVEESLRDSQAETWKRVQEYTSNSAVKMESLRMARSVDDLSELYKRRGSDDLEGYLGAQERIIDDAMRNIPADHVRQVGLVVVDMRGIAGLEFFDHPDSWAALSRSVTRNYAEILAQMASDMFEIRMDRVKSHVDEYLRRLRGIDGSLAFSEGIYQTYEIGGEDLVGEFTMFYGSLVHVLTTRRDEIRTPGYPAPSRQVDVEDRMIDRNWDSRLRNVILSTNRNMSFSESNIESFTAPRQVSAKEIIEYLTKKRGYKIIMSLKVRSQSFNELQRSTGMSTATVTKSLREAEALHLVQKSYRVEVDSTVYELTQEGKLLQPEKFKATLEG